MTCHQKLTVQLNSTILRIFWFFSYFSSLFILVCFTLFSPLCPVLFPARFSIHFHRIFSSNFFTLIFTCFGSSLGYLFPPFPPPILGQSLSFFLFATSGLMSLRHRAATLLKSNLTRLLFHQSYSLHPKPLDEGLESVCLTYSSSLC